MPSEQKVALPIAELSSHFRQGVLSLASHISDLDHADWPTIRDTWESLREETKGTHLEKPVESLRDPIRRQHTHALAQTIDTLLREN